VAGKAGPVITLTAHDLQKWVMARYLQTTRMTFMRALVAGG